MGLPTPPEGFHSSQQALLDLERSKVSPVELLDEVPQILGVRYGDLSPIHFSRTKDDKKIPDAAGFAPKEEWVLRWLLKRSGLSTSGGTKIKISSEDASRYGTMYFDPYDLN